MIKGIVIFLAGAAVGGTAVWFYQEKKYETLINEEIESVKEAFSNRETKVNEEDDEPTDVSESLQELADKARNKFNIMEYQSEVNKTDYATTSVSIEDVVRREIDDLKEKVVIKPYIIDQGDFREFEDYGHITMDYYTDKVLADADHPDVPVSDISEYVGDCLKNVNEDRIDDWIYVRNENKKVDIEIFINDKPFSEREDE